MGDHRTPPLKIRAPTVSNRRGRHAVKLHGVARSTGYSMAANVSRAMRDRAAISRSRVFVSAANPPRRRLASRSRGTRPGPSPRLSHVSAVEVYPSRQCDRSRTMTSLNLEFMLKLIDLLQPCPKDRLQFIRGQWLFVTWRIEHQACTRFFFDSNNVRIIIIAPFTKVIIIRRFHF